MDFQSKPGSLEPWTAGWAGEADKKDELSYLREQFLIPTKADLLGKIISLGHNFIPCLKISVRSCLMCADLQSENDTSELCVYLCGNSLGLQPRRTREFILRYLQTWAKKGVTGHFWEPEDCFTSSWVNLDDRARTSMSHIVGAEPSEVAVMQTLSVNLHLLLFSFYQPTKERFKIIIEEKAFPSDHVSRHCYV